MTLQVLLECVAQLDNRYIPTYQESNMDCGFFHYRSILFYLTTFGQHVA